VPLLIQDIGHTDIAAGTKNHTHPAPLTAMYIKLNISHLTALLQNKFIKDNVATLLLTVRQNTAVVPQIIAPAQAIARKNRFWTAR
jgi:hypothetical protein